MQSMKNWRNILQSKKFFLILTIICFLVTLMAFLKKETPELDNQKTEMIGIIEDYSFDGDLLKMTIKGKEKIIAFYTIRSEAEKEELLKKIQYGLTIRCEGTLKQPTENQIPNTFSYRTYLKTKQIFYIMILDKIEIKRKPNFLYSIKNLVASRILKFTESPYLKAFFLGDSKDLNQEELRKNGISHLFAISGMHLAFFLSLWQKFFPKRGKNRLILSFILFFYLFLVNFPPSFLRVILFYHLKELSSIWKINWNLYQLFWVTFCLMLFFNPFFLLNQGFQYSFLLSFGLLFLKKENSFFKNLIKTSCYLFFLSLPLNAIYQYECNFLSIFLNILFIPLLSILYPLAFFIFLFPGMSLCLKIFHLFDGLNHIASTISFLTIIIPKVSFLFWLGYYFCFFIFWKTKKKKYMILIFLLLLGIKLMPYLDSKGYVIFLDVGQADAALWISPHRKNTILIDTGGEVSYEKKEWAKRKEKNYQAQNIITYLHSLGITKIDTCIFSHGDEDHMGNAKELLSHFKIKNMILNKGNVNELEQAVLEEGKKQKVNILNGISELKGEDYKIEFLNTKEYQNENDNSNVIYLEYSYFSFLFMGDASEEKEQDILKKYDIKNIFVLKVGHHGSKTSSSKSFIDKINPRYAIISVGENNRYHHPNKEVIDNLSHSQIYRTDQNGTIIVELEKKKYQIITTKEKNVLQ